MKFWWISSYSGEIPNNAVLLLCPSKLWGSRVHFVTGSEIPASIAPHSFHGVKTSSREFQLVPVTLVINKLHSPLWERDEPPDCSWTWPLLWNADQVCGVSNLFLLSIKRAIMQIYRTTLWAHYGETLKCWTSETPLSSGRKENVVNQRRVTRAPLSVRGAVPKMESCRLRIQIFDGFF